MSFLTPFSTFISRLWLKSSLSCRTMLKVLTRKPLKKSPVYPKDQEKGTLRSRDCGRKMPFFPRFFCLFSAIELHGPSNRKPREKNLSLLSEKLGNRAPVVQKVWGEFSLFFSLLSLLPLLYLRGTLVMRNCKMQRSKSSERNLSF